MNTSAQIISAQMHIWISADRLEAEKYFSFSERFFHHEVKRKLRYCNRCLVVN